MVNFFKSSHSPRGAVQVELCGGPQNPVNRAVKFRREYLLVGCFPSPAATQDMGQALAASEGPEAVGGKGRVIRAQFDRADCNRVQCRHNLTGFFQAAACREVSCFD